LGAHFAKDDTPTPPARSKKRRRVRSPGASKGQSCAEEQLTLDELENRQRVREGNVRVTKEKPFYKFYAQAVPKEARTSQPRTPPFQDLQVPVRIWKRMMREWDQDLKRWCQEEGYTGP
jgi:hypothetical protein